MFLKKQLSIYVMYMSPPYWHPIPNCNTCRLSARSTWISPGNELDFPGKVSPWERLAGAGCHGDRQPYTSRHNGASHYGEQTSRVVSRDSLRRASHSFSADLFLISRAHEGKGDQIEDRYCQPARTTICLQVALGRESVCFCLTEVNTSTLSSMSIASTLPRQKK